MSTVYLLLGSNMGNSKQKLLTAIRYIEKEIGSVTRQSHLYKTAAWGKTDQPDFINQVIIVETSLDPQQTIKTILSIEKKMGRIRTEKNAPRIIDIDILFFGKQVINETELIIPHPQLANRRFVLIPLNELSPLLKHPVLKKTIHHLLRVCADKLPVNKI
jgi:2-amino-4-hydroxy-6-hydroxymethyldihydropteridine diphosphokinase